jgi:hypothetical protein
MDGSTRIRHHLDVCLAFAHVALERGECAVEVIDHLRRRGRESFRGCLAQAAILVYQGYGTVPRIKAAGAQHE